ncbi:hypothetical protein KC049_002265, partial [Salmonella enterica subsp. enterica serovar Alachua]|nr:hypothetical protein [Salmonella enterica subsp. enterica serovar Alachua]
KPKSVAYHFEGCTNLILNGNKSYGADIGYEIINSPDTVLVNNSHYSAETVQLIIEAEKAIQINTEEIKNKLGEDKLHEIVNILREIKSNQSSTPLQLMERLYSAGANTLTFWPIIQQLLNSI